MAVSHAGVRGRERLGGGLAARMSTPASIDESSANVSPIGSVGNFDNAVNEANNVEVNESPIDVEDDEVEENPFAAKKRKKTSKVWDEFKEVTLSDGTKKAEFFNHFMRTVSPNWERISRGLSKKDCISAYDIEKKRLTSLLKEVDRVSITTDLWTSTVQDVEYMVVTCHFVDYDWKLQKRMLCFRSIVPPHTGVAVCDELARCIADWGLEKKLMSVSVDNASYNDVAVNLLKANLNLNNQNFKSLGSRWACDITKQLNLSNKKLVLDVCTRWNATYYMLQAALDLKDVFPRYQLRDSNYHYLPSEEDWSKVQTVCTFLEEFHYVTNVISGCEYPTSNLFLLELTTVKKALSKHVEDDNDFMRQMAARMIRKFDKYWGDNNLLISIAAILDPRNKMTLVEWAFPFFYSVDDVPNKMSFVRSSLYKLYNEYVEAFKAKSDIDTQSQLSAPTTSSSSSASVGRSRERAEFDNFIRNVGSFQLIKSELDVYLEEGVHIHNESIDPPFDVLEWWKANYLKFRVLSKMACDVLSIPITTVPSESAFSMTKRVIESHRASLAPATVEALMCGGDWLRAYYGIQRKKKGIITVVVRLFCKVIPLRNRSGKHKNLNGSQLQDYNTNK
ncbi:zinc finger BED domain-containing protein RICESLEEPER 3-like [Dioscorea cayenensis subsp. rotundata]|uniref:Zinc finger BED domain-containing protein RICESLEEPER 3-like n=1 Tax=Dioscorea cayennensis subsp. rotundata TaxID=55577 RepID=A0AB40BHN1_DIOCR|nr:zinc finger BED domain-containing protein RICESLEEPER 3-like [Dioscorea cayenensis subsp. rotundata]